MKRNPAEQTGVERPDGHRVVEVLGLTATNTSRYSVAFHEAPARSRSVARQNQFDEIVIVEGGEGDLVQDHTRESIRARDVILLTAGTRYWFESGDEGLRFWTVCVPAFRPEWSQVGETRRDWRDFQTPRGADRLRPNHGG